MVFEDMARATLADYKGIPSHRSRVEYWCQRFAACTTI